MSDRPPPTPGRLVPASLNAGTAVAAVETTLSVEGGDAFGGVRVDRESGLIQDVAILTAGPARGHGWRVTERTLDSFLAAYQADPEQFQVRISHPGPGEDGLMKLVGEPENLRIRGDQLRGDIRLLPPQILENSPVGPGIRDYLLGMAELKPRLLGLSVVGMVELHGSETSDPYGADAVEEEPEGVWREAWAIDFVARPAANRNGMLSAGSPEGANGPSQNTQDKGSVMNKRLVAFLKAALGISEEEVRKMSLAQAKSKLAEVDKKWRPGLRVLTAEGLSDAQRSEQLEELGLDAKEPHTTLLSQPAPAPAPGSTPAPGSGASEPAVGNPTAVGASTPAALAAVGAPATQGDVSGRAALTADQARDQANQMVRADRSRRNSITALAANHPGMGFDDAWVREQHESQLSIDRIRTDMLERIVAARQPVGNLRVTAGGNDPSEQFALAFQDVLAERIGLEGHVEEAAGEQSPRTRAHALQSMRLARGEGGRDLRYRDRHEMCGNLDALSFVELARHYITRAGGDTQGLPAKAVVQSLMDPHMMASLGVQQARLAHVTGDFPLLMGNVLRKGLSQRYEEEVPSWTAVATVRLVNDTKPHQEVKVGRLPLPPVVPEGGEYAYATVGEGSTTVQVLKHGDLFPLTLEAMINDDLGGLAAGLMGFSQRCRVLENYLVWGKILDNVVQEEDGVALFHASHNNLNKGGAGAPTIQRMAAMRAAAMTQRGIPARPGEVGRPVNARLNVVVVPPTLGPETSVLVASQTKPGGTNREPNYAFLRDTTVVEEPILEFNSTTEWFMAARANAANPSAKLVKLRGSEQPTVEQISTGGSVDGVTYKTRHWAGGAADEYRNWQKNDGA